MNEQRRNRATSLWVLPLEAGGCAACGQSIAALQARKYQHALQDQNIEFVTSPRHANVVLVTGVLNVASAGAIQRVIDAVPQPRVIVAVGSCATDGCVFRNSAALVDTIAEALDVNVELPGCPPEPDTILAALAEAAELLATAGDAEVAPDEVEEADEAVADEEGHDA